MGHSCLKDHLLYAEENPRPTRLIILLARAAAILSFPRFDGAFEYLGFTSKDDRAFKWCNDLFKYYWERAEPKNKFNLRKALLN